MSDSPRAEDQGALPLVVSGDARRAAETNKSRFDELTRQAIEDGLYDVDADAYKEVLAQARKQS
ncbi:MAG: hypothetical protein QM677_02850 [Microbacterium sp.]